MAKDGEDYHIEIRLLTVNIIIIIRVVVSRFPINTDNFADELDLVL